MVKRSLTTTLTCLFVSMAICAIFRLFAASGLDTHCPEQSRVRKVWLLRLVQYRVPGTGFTLIMQPLKPLALVVMPNIGVRYCCAAPCATCGYRSRSRHASASVMEYSLFKIGV